MGNSTKILIVDDEHSVCISLSEYLRDQGFEVEALFSAEESLEYLNKNIPEIMIVDIRLPGIDGTKLIQKVHELYPDIQYLIHTGSVAFSLPDYLIKIGLTQDHVLKKPVRNLKVFNDKINLLIKNK